MTHCREMNALFDKGRRDAIRGAVASGDLSTVLRRPSEPAGALRHLSVFIPSSPGVPMEEAIRRADEAGFVIASNKKIDSLLNSDYWESIEDAFQCWTGTMTGYVEPGRTFREAGEWVDALKSHAIVYVDEQTNIRYLFPVPDEHLERKDSILVTEHPGFRLETDGNDRIVRAAQVSLIERFPAEVGWYEADAQFRIPFGDAPAPEVDTKARYLFRLSKNRIGLVARGCNGYRSDNDWRGVGLDYWASGGLGMAVETKIS